jgi:dihydropyrimidinase/allantoinase
MDEDAISESTSAIYGGVTTICSYFRTGQNYLNKTGSYKEIFPEIMEKSRYSFLTDYTYHIAIMSPEQLREMEMLVTEFGVSTFKYYMFYKLLDLAGAPGGDKYLMLNTAYDFGFLYQYMKEVARLNEKYKEYGPIRLSVHCEQPEIIRIFTQFVKENMTHNPLKDYSNARPPFSEKLAIKEVETLATETNCPLNILHLSSEEAVKAGKEASNKNPELQILLESTLHHLGLSNEISYGKLGKVNPPIRGSQDVEALWKAILNGTINTVVSDHACLTQKIKEGDLWSSLPGFGGTELFFPLLFTEGYQKRGLSLQRISEITSFYPALYHGLYPKKGTIAIGSDADIVIVDPEVEKVISPQTLHSAQDFCPFEGKKYKGWPILTVLRGKIMLEKDKIMGKPGDGQYIKRPVKLHYPEYRKCECSFLKFKHTE